MALRKYSRQREAIRAFLATRKDHPTADMVYQHIRVQYPNISLGTVYRNLSLLADDGEIQRIHAGDGIDRYDADLSPHCHVICTRCHSVSDLWLEGTEEINRIAAGQYPGRILGHCTIFHGICPQCIARETNG